ncbi:MAG: molybdate ABC transporter substrate-binding protein [Spirochaetaceae bacterium]|nr:MAG: molybdate ABC transporter substrate-binding protein [Spirochaetaceae bacterium]
MLCTIASVFQRRREAMGSRTYRTTDASASMYFRIAFLAVVAVFLGAACSRPDGQGAQGNDDVLIAAAADLRFALNDIVTLYLEETGIEVTVNYGSTGLMTQQIENGAPIDLFLAADLSFAQRLYEGGHSSGEPVPYALGYLALAVPEGGVLPNLADIRELSDPRYEVIAIANPSHAPYGTAAFRFLEGAGLLEELRPRLVYGENVLDTLRLVQTGSADLGLVAAAFLPNARDFHGVLLEPERYEPLLQTAVLTNGGANIEGGRQFLEFIMSPVGAEVLSRYLFGIPE